MIHSPEMATALYGCQHQPQIGTFDRLYRPSIVTAQESSNRGTTCGENIPQGGAKETHDDVLSGPLDHSSDIRPSRTMSFLLAGQALLRTTGHIIYSTISRRRALERAMQRAYEHTRTSGFTSSSQRFPLRIAGSAGSTPPDKIATVRDGVYSPRCSHSL